MTSDIEFDPKISALISFIKFDTINCGRSARTKKVLNACEITGSL
jgi:hypothetical protein